MSLQLLPVETLENIASHLVRARDLRNWAATSRRHFEIAELPLYRAFGDHALTWAACHGHEDTARKCLSLVPEVVQLSHVTAAATYNREGVLELLLGVGRMRDELVAGKADHQHHSPVGNAAENGSIGALRQLLAIPGVNLMVEDWRNNRKPLQWALFQGCGEAALLLLAHGVSVMPSDYHERGQQSSPLLLAIERRNSLEVVQALLDHGANVMAEPRALSDAAKLGSVDVVELLLKRGADIEAPANNSAKPLYAASRCWDSSLSIQVLKVLLEHGADPLAVDNTGLSALHGFARYGTPAAVSILLEHGATAGINSVDDSGHTPLHYTVDPDIVQLLLDNGADPNIPDENGITALHTAKKPETAKLLIEAGADIDAVCHQVRTPFNHALYRGKSRSAVAEWLIRNGADVHRGIYDPNKPPVWTAVRYGLTEILRLLLEKGFDLQAPPDQGGTAVEKAIERRDAPMVELLISHAASHNIQLPWGELVSKAVSYGSMEIAHSLLVNAGDFHVDDVRGRGLMLEGAVRLAESDPSPGPLSPTCPARPKRGDEVIKMLVQHGANPNRVTDEQTPLVTALRLSATSGDPYKVQALLECGADPNLAANHGYHPPMYVAATYGFLSAAKLLVEHGAYLQSKTYQDETLLMTAAGGFNHGETGEQRIELCRWLLGKGLDAASVDSAGRTALGYRKRQLAYLRDRPVREEEDKLSEMLAEHERRAASLARLQDKDTGAESS
ncbi:hypothetical protein ACO1O0_007609 [Amphichorda felina]